jgi:membrane protein DedA with SNARE-associated domain
MEEWIQTASQHIDQAHWILLGMLFLAGLNVPFSEDLIVLTAGALAATISPLEPWQFYLIIFLGCWTSAWEAYWLGRLVGPKLYEIRWFNWLLTKERVDKLHVYYERFGVYTFLVGRFIPGGFRNVLFISSGMGKMPFPLFLARDFPAVLLSSSVLFSLGFAFGNNFEELITHFKFWSFWLLVTVIVTGIIITLIWWGKNKRIC